MTDLFNPADFLGYLRTVDKSFTYALDQSDPTATPARYTYTAADQTRIHLRRYGPTTGCTLTVADPTEAYEESRTFDSDFDLYFGFVASFTEMVHNVRAWMSEHPAPAGDNADVANQPPPAGDTSRAPALPPFVKSLITHGLPEAPKKPRDHQSDVPDSLDNTGTRAAFEAIFDLDLDLGPEDYPVLSEDDPVLTSSPYLEPACNVCARPRGDANWGWNSSGSVWCPDCKDAYWDYLNDHPLPQGPTLHHPALGPIVTTQHLPAYMMLPEEWPTIGFTSDLLDPYRPGGAKYKQRP